MAPPQVVLIADVVRSRDVREFRRLRDRTLSELSESHADAGWIEPPWAVTAWDEFQGLVPAPADAPRVLWSLRRAFHPLRLRVGLGRGAVDRDPGSTAPVNLGATGEAFVRAREAIEAVGRPRDLRLEPITEARTGSPDVDRAASSLLHLLDLTAGRITDSQWLAIDAVERHGRQDRAAEALGKDESTVSRALKRASYQHILDGLEALGILLGRWRGDATEGRPA